MPTGKSKTNLLQHNVCSSPPPKSYCFLTASVQEGEYLGGDSNIMKIVKKNLYTSISLFSFLELVNAKEWILQGLFQELWLKGILPEMSLTVVNACILPCMKRYKINIGFSHIQNVFIQYLSFQSDYKVGWGCSLAFGSRNLKYCHIIREKKSDVLIYKPQANVCLWIIDQGFQNKIS